MTTSELPPGSSTEPAGDEPSSWLSGLTSLKLAEWLSVEIGLNDPCKVYRGPHDSIQGTVNLKFGPNDETSKRLGSKLVSKVEIDLILSGTVSYGEEWSGNYEDLPTWIATKQLFRHNTRIYDGSITFVDIPFTTSFPTSCSDPSGVELPPSIRVVSSPDTHVEHFWNDSFVVHYRLDAVCTAVEVENISEVKTPRPTYLDYGLAPVPTAQINRKRDRSALRNINIKHNIGAKLLKIPYHASLGIECTSLMDIHPPCCLSADLGVIVDPISLMKDLRIKICDISITPQVCAGVTYHGEHHSTLRDRPSLPCTVEGSKQTFSATDGWVRTIVSDGPLDANLVPCFETQIDDGITVFQFNAFKIRAKLKINGRTVDYECQMSGTVCPPIRVEDSVKSVDRPVATESEIVKGATTKKTGNVKSALKKMKVVRRWGGVFNRESEKAPPAYK